MLKVMAEVATHMEIIEQSFCSTRLYCFHGDYAERLFYQSE